MKQYNFGEKYFLRDIMGAYMSTLGEKNEKVVIVNADLSGTSRNKDFVKKFPQRSFNVGIAEQNMIKEDIPICIRPFAMKRTAISGSPPSTAPRR